MLVKTCPNCGGALGVVTLGGDHAPWVCVACRLGFWDAEIDSANRLHWRPGRRDFGHGPQAAAIRSAVASQHAKQRGGV